MRKVLSCAAALLLFASLAQADQVLPGLHLDGGNAVRVPYGAGTLKLGNKDLNGLVYPDAAAVVEGLGYTPLPHVGSASQLAAFTSFTTPVVRDSYAAFGDSAPATYYHITSACAAADGGTQIGGTSGCWLLQPGQRVTPELFGADRTGVVDSATAVQAWLTSLGANGLPGTCTGGATYLFKTALTTSTANAFSIDGRCTLKYAGSNTTNDIWLFSGASATARLSNVRITGPMLLSSTVMTAGYGVHLRWVDHSAFDMRWGDYVNSNRNLYNGVWFDQSNFDSVSGQAYASFDGVSVSSGTDLTVSAFRGLGNGRSAIHVGGGWGALYLISADVSCIYHTDGNSNGSALAYMPIGLLIDNSLAASMNYQVFVGQAAVFDSCAGAPVYVSDTATQSGGTPPPLGLRVLSFAGWASGSQSGGANSIPGLYIKAWGNGTVQVVGGSFLQNNQGPGLQVDDATARISIDPAANINGNQNYGVLCTSPTNNIVASAKPLGNLTGDYSSNCQGTIRTAKPYAYVPVLTCVTGSLPSGATATGTFSMDAYNTDFQVEVRVGTTAGTCTNMTVSAPKDLTGSVKTPFAAYIFKGRDNSSGAAVVAAVGPGGGSFSVTGDPNPSTNVTPANGDMVINGRYANSVGQ